VIDRTHVKKLYAQEEERFLARTPKSRKMFGAAKQVMPGGVPMSWMATWPGNTRYL
jgi:glutamate-1-semialdehyde 2,1-aminomutase